MSSLQGVSAERDPAERVAADVFSRGCPSRHTMETVASKWGVLALVALRDGPYRFNALRRRVDGVSEKMLARTLQALERDGLVTREVHTAFPPRVEYELTDIGQQVACKLQDLVDVIQAATPEVFAAQARYDAANPLRSGGSAQPADSSQP